MNTVYDTIEVFDEVNHSSELFEINENYCTKCIAKLDLDIKAFPRYCKPEESSIDFTSFTSKNRFDISCSFLLKFNSLKKLLVFSKCSSWDIDESTPNDSMLRIYNFNTRKLEIEVVLKNENDVLKVVETDEYLFFLTSNGKVFYQSKSEFLQNPDEIFTNRIDSFKYFATSILIMDGKILIGTSTCRIFMLNFSFEIVFAFRQTRGISVKLIQSPFPEVFASVNQGNSADIYNFNDSDPIFSTPSALALIVDASFFNAKSFSWKKEEKMKKKDFYFIVIFNSGKISAFPIFQSAINPSSLVLADKRNFRDFKNLIASENLLFLGDENGEFFVLFPMMKVLKSVITNQNYELKNLKLKKIFSFSETGVKIGELPDKNSESIDNSYKNSISYCEKLDENWIFVACTNGIFNLWRCDQIPF